MKRETVFGIAWLAAGILAFGYGIVAANLPIVFLAGLSWLAVTGIVVFYRRRMAINRHGLPSLPAAISDITLGPADNALSAFLSSLPEVADKTRRSLFGSTLKHSLREGKLETDEGTWAVELELCNASIVGFTVAFDSKKDSRLNRTWGRTGWRAFFLSDYDQ